MRKIFLVLTTSILLVFPAVSLAVPDGSPEAPADLAAAAFDGRVMLSWTAPADNGSAVIRYEYRVGDDGGSTWNPDWTEVPSSAASTTGHAVDGLTNGTAYVFGVRAVNGNGAGAGAGVSAVAGSMEPLAVAGCTDGTYVDNPSINTGLVSDCEALVALRNHWTSRSANAGLPGTHPLRTWGSGNSTIGSWAGVSVSGRRVIGLDLRVARNVTAGRISGTLPTQLGNLASLAFLHLGGNKLTGSIPEELGGLAGLKHLHLDGNELTGSIPGELGDLASLMFLDLGDNKLTGSIPGELGGLTGLKHLHLDGNELTESIPEELGDLASLRSLYLNGNELTGPIPGELGDLSSLTFLDLGDNGLTGSIPEEFENLTGLTRLHLDGNELTESIPGELGDLASLRSLYLNGNELTGSIPGELGDLSSLMFLDLGDNKLTGSIPEELGDLTSLRRLHLNGNELRGSIPGELGDLSSLAFLHLSDNQLSGSVPEELGDLSPSQDGSLIRLLICRNMLSVILPADLRSVDGDASGCVPAPAGLVATADEEQVTLSWTDPGNRDIKNYQYRVCGAGGVNCGAWTKIPGSGASTVSYVAYRLENGRDHLFQLRAADRSGPGMSAEVAARPGLPEPTVNAGSDQTVGEGEAVTLSGSVTDTENQALTYLWEQTGGTPKVTLSGADTATASFTAPNQIISDAALVFRLTVNDGINSVADKVTVTVTAGTNDAPTADAGGDQTVDEGAAVTLDGSGSSDPEGETLTYAWTLIHAWAGNSRTTATLSSSTVQSPTFTAPTQLATSAVLVFFLVVTDARGLKSSSDWVTVIVTAGTNDAPTADAGDDQTVDEGAAVTLDGSGSGDPEREALTYAWTKTSGPAVTLSSSTAQSPTFTAPTQLASDAVFVFSLVVTDARRLKSSADTVTITVTAGPNDAPTADAGKDRTVAAGASVTLDASGSSDPENDDLTYLWKQLSGTAVTLNNATSAKATFTAPRTSSSHALEFQLTVSDGLRSATDSIVVKVNAYRPPPPTPGRPILLKRTGPTLYYRADNGNALFQWTFTYGAPAGGVAVSFYEARVRNITGTSERVVISSWYRTSVLPGETTRALGHPQSSGFFADWDVFYWAEIRAVSRSGVRGPALRINAP